MIRLAAGGVRERFMGYQEKFADEEWNLLVGLPQAVLLAASAAEHDGTRRTLAEGAAGMEAISEARLSGNGLVELIAGEVVNRVGDPELGEEPPVLMAPADTGALLEDCLARAKQATALLAERVDEGDAGAYKHWLVTIAEQVVGANSISAAEQSFVGRLTKVLGD